MKNNMLLVDKRIQLNPELSWNAKMVHTLLLNQDKCGSSINEMAEYVNESEEFIKTGLKELEENGFIEA